MDKGSTSPTAVEEALTPEQVVWLAAARAALSSAFGIPEHQLRVVDASDGADAPLPVVIDASPNGTYAGTYDRLMEARAADPAHLTVTVEHEQMDVLEASTEAAYRAMMEDARDRGGPLPDSLELSQINGELWTATMALGDGLQDDGLVPLLSSSGGTTNKVGFHRDRGGKSIRVRPALRVPVRSDG